MGGCVPGDIPVMGWMKVAARPSCRVEDIPVVPVAWGMAVPAEHKGTGMCRAVPGAADTECGQTGLRMVVLSVAL